jgi:hypothetical protein
MTAAATASRSSQLPHALPSRTTYKADGVTLSSVPLGGVVTPRVGVRRQTADRSDLSERERVRLGAGFEEGDLQRPLADGAVLAYELVHAAVAQQTGPVLGDVHAV